MSAAFTEIYLLIFGLKPETISLRSFKDERNKVINKELITIADNLVLHYGSN